MQLKRTASTLLVLLLTGCLGMPKSVEPVDNFELQRYLGQWYEIARLEHRFEEGLEQITANYSLRDDGGVKVVNRGLETATGQWRNAEGRAYFVDNPDKAYLKVSFFGPFYGAYVVFGLDQKDYQYAFVSGPDTSYLWLLARSPEVEPWVIEQFIEQASARGFDTDALIFVDHSKAMSLDKLNNTEILFDHLGKPSETEHFVERGMAFEHFYYKNLDHSFLVNTELWEVCHQYPGKKRLSCFPCAASESTSACKERLQKQTQ
jgi:apolipoprotein D and lipocalin family protein